MDCVFIYDDIDNINHTTEVRNIPRQGNASGICMNYIAIGGPSYTYSAHMQFKQQYCVHLLLRVINHNAAY